MNVKCKNCSGENPIGSIFCRLCGAKLTFKEIDAEIKKNLKNNGAKKNYRIIFRLILLIFLVCVLYLAYLIFDPFRSAMAPLPISKEEGAQTISIMSKIDSGAKGTYSLTSAQLDFLAKRYLTQKNKEISAGIVKDKYIKFSYSEIVFNYYVKIEISKTVLIEPIINDKGENILSFKLHSIELGNLPLPKFLGDFFVDDFKPFKNSSRINRILKKIDNLSIHNNTVELIAE
ncbi:MAG TPA: hypothetical protein DD381_11850 [Lentisphaeria bacterium]|nr:MAG: hypothetical protein A2X47_02585 [Lentisphaerae bacterium GWF2_38_69]HBM17019.1 hypothetical protein [Lentisphaeria bacterium]